MPSMEAQPVRETVKSVRTALRVIEEIAARQPIGVADLARAMAVPKTTLQRSLVTLSSMEWVERASEGPMWRLHPRIANLLERSVTSVTLVEAANPVVRQLATETDESVLLSEPRGDHMSVIDAMDSSQLIRASAPIGSSIPLHASAGGKAYLSAISQDRLSDALSGPLQDFTSHTLSRADLLDQISVARGDGFAVQLGEWADALSSVAAPVVVAGKPVAALVVYGPAGRLSEQRLHELGPTVVDHAARISARVGHG